MTYVAPDPTFEKVSDFVSFNAMRVRTDTCTPTHAHTPLPFPPEIDVYRSVSFVRVCQRLNCKTVQINIMMNTWICFCYLPTTLLLFQGWRVVLCGIYSTIFVYNLSRNLQMIFHKLKNLCFIRPASPVGVVENINRTLCWTC